MARTKEQIIQYLRGLDTSLLQKLERYSEFLIIPDENLLTDTTMLQLVDRAHELADTLFPEWTDRSKSDFGEFLVELFAVFSEKDFWYINAFANEGILRKMRLYSNAFSQASALGYYPTLCRGSEAVFSVTFAAGSEITYGIGDLVINVAGTKFTNNVPATIPAQNSERTVSMLLREGTYYYEDVPFNGFNIMLRKKNIDVDSVMVTIDELTYERVPNFGMSGNNSAHFMVLPEEDGSCTIYFGDNGFGMKPALGKSVRVGYRRCKGSDGNVPYNEATVYSDLPDRQVTAVAMQGDAQYGVYAESITSIKEKAPLYFYTKRAAINEEVSEAILNSFSFIYQSKVWRAGGEVHYKVIPTSGNPDLVSSEIQALVQQFHPYIMLGFTPVYETNTYKDLLQCINADTSKLKAILYVVRGSALEDMEIVVRQMMDDITNPLISAKYGKGFVRSEVIAQMMGNIAGLQNVVFKYRLHGHTTWHTIGDVSIGATDIFQAINQEDLIVEFIEQ